MEIEFTPKALSQLDYWKKTGNDNILRRIRALLESIEHLLFQVLVNRSYSDMNCQVFGRDALMMNIGWYIRLRRVG